MATDGLSTALLDAAERAFGKHGYAGATLERIAQEASVSRVTLHRHKVTREALLEALAERATEDYRRALWGPMTGVGSAAQRLRSAFEALCDVAEEHMVLLLAVRAQTDRVFHESADEATLTRTVYTEPLERLLRDGAADGSLREVDPVETATVLFNMVGWTYIHLRSGHRWDPQRAKVASIDPIFRGLISDPR